MLIPYVFLYSAAAHGWCNFSGWCQWKPTSLNHLVQAETKMLECKSVISLLFNCMYIVYEIAMA